jgi:sugar phosphate isomerase/epimerase
MASGDYVINNLYQPGYSSFKPGEIEPHNYLGRKNMIDAKSVGVATNPTVANQLGELSKTLNTGTIPVEVGTLDLKNFDSIPKEHWEEMRRKADLNDARVTIHSPLVDPSGFGERGWDETQQRLAERQLMQIMDKATILTSKKNPQPIPVTIHPSNSGGSTYKFIIDPVTKKREKVADKLVAVDRATGQLAPMERDVRYQIGSNDLEKGTVRSAEKMLESANQTQWSKEIDKVLYEKEAADNVLNKIFPAIKPAYYALGTGEIDENSLTPKHKQLFEQLSIGQAHLEDAKLSLNSIFEKAYKYSTPEKQKELRVISNKFAEELGIIQDKETLKKLSKEDQSKMIEKQLDLQNQARIIQETAKVLEEFNPNMLQRVEDFTIEKSSETLKNVALHNYEKAKKEKIDYKYAPQISVENLYQGMGFSQTQDVVSLVEKTRNTFQTELMEKEGLNSTEAKKIAEQMIGATFDVGHLNLSRKHGFTEEDMKKEAETIGKYVNKVHLTDNFGNEDTHLAPGMGNVPFELLLDALGDAGKKAVKINEIGGYTMNFGKVAYAETLAAFGSPIYSSGQGPYWSQTTGFQQSYSGGMGLTLPAVNYETFGSGFSTLPQELGGSRGQGAGGRMGGGDV